ncbi:hypothetical protein [Halosegnis sp.]|uniref:hypothetical protein n=1 Tax=Halosegnis sp. TaxID=2864959 RepID=UPI0035D41A8F
MCDDTPRTITDDTQRAERFDQNGERVTHPNPATALGISNEIEARVGLLYSW